MGKILDYFINQGLKIDMVRLFTAFEKGDSIPESTMAVTPNNHKTGLAGAGTPGLSLVMVARAEHIYDKLDTICSTCPNWFLIGRSNKQGVDLRHT
jgi:hypothetical protein